MTNPQDPHNPLSDKAERSHPEMGSDRDALNLVRKRRTGRMSSQVAQNKFRLTMPIKIGAVALFFTGVVLSVWTMRSAHTPLTDEDLPVITAELDMDQFKIAPRKEDVIQIPHSDKEFYSELEPGTSHPQENAFRNLPERPSPQISQAALSKKPTPLPEAILETAPTTTPTVNVQVVDNAGDARKQAYKAPLPTTRTSKTKKTLEMAIQDTQKEMRQKARQLSVDPTLSKKTSVAQKASTQKVSSPLKAPGMANRGRGKYWVQVASLPTQAAAQKEAKRLQLKSKKELKSQKFRTIRVDLGKPKGIRYRVHFGPFPRSQAIQKCQNLKGNEKMACLVMKG